MQIIRGDSKLILLKALAQYEYLSRKGWFETFCHLKFVNICSKFTLYPTRHVVGRGGGMGTQARAFLTGLSRGQARL